MKAVVMAGGLGTRLLPLTRSCPKTMIPLVNKPVLAYLIELLKEHSFTEVVITTRRDNDHIQQYFGNGRQFGVTIEYVVEDSPLGTAGGVKNAQPYLDGQPFLVVSGDAVTDLDLSRLWSFHQGRGGLLTLAAKHVADPSENGAVLTGRLGQVHQYQEKPGDGPVISHLVNTGIYVVEPELLNYMEPNQAYDFSHDVFSWLLGQGLPFFGYVTRDYWGDMGTIPGYLKATADVLWGRVKHVDLGEYKGLGIWTGGMTRVARTANLCGPVYLGRGVKIQGGVTINGPAVIGEGAVVERDAVIDRAVVGPNTFIGRSVRLENAVVPERCHILHSVMPEIKQTGRLSLATASSLAGQPAA